MSTESFLAIWPSQYKFLTNEFLLKKSVYAHGLYGNDSVLGQDSLGNSRHMWHK